MDFIREDKIGLLGRLISEASRVVVAGHIRPDGDALGSTAALALYLQGMGKDVTVVFPDTPADNLRFILPTSVRYAFADKDPEKVKEAADRAQLLFLLDCNAFSRTESIAGILAGASAGKVLIDHHLNPDTEAFDVSFSTPGISSASELLYWVLKALGWDGSDLPVGEALLTGMTTDTNNFANSVFPSTFRMASELIAAGVDRDALLQRIYNSYRENRVRLMGYMQYEGLTVLPEGAAYMVLTRDIQQRFDLQEGESEGLVNVPLTIGSVRLSVLLKEDNGHFRVSVRSKKGTSAQQLAHRFFHGGGHENAAGGKLFIGTDVPSPETVPSYLETLLKDFLR